MHNSQIADFFDKKMLKKYNTAGPRYTSYPTAVAFDSDFTESNIIEAVSTLKAHNQRSLSLYLHIPFCHSLCYYCGCNKIVTRNQDKIEKYLAYLKTEIDMRCKMFDGFTVEHIHFGGGTPSFLDKQQLSSLLEHINTKFKLKPGLEQSIEIDPRKIELDYVNELKEIGFNRISIGVQDVNEVVQEKINRLQSTDFILQLIERAKSLKFKSVNIDLIYGLPKQTDSTLKETLDQVKAMNPDRISLFSYAHMPNLFSAQRKIKDDWLPNSDEKFALFRQSISELSNQGYEFIGMDHFAKPEDELSIAASNQSLSRNFQGYTTDSANALLGLGVSSISNFETAYAQNVKKLGEYYAAIDEQRIPLEKGVSLSKEDQIHRAIIHQLMCNLYVNKADFSAKYEIDFDQYFCDSLSQLDAFIDDNLLENTDTHLKIFPRGRLLVRNICMNFDQYLSKPMHQLRYSRVI